MFYDVKITEIFKDWAILLIYFPIYELSILACKFHYVIFVCEYKYEEKKIRKKCGIKLEIGRKFFGILCQKKFTGCLWPNG